MRATLCISGYLKRVLDALVECIRRGGVEIGEDLRMCVAIFL